MSGKVEMDARFHQLAAEGKTRTEIAKELSVSLGLISRRVVSTGVSVKRFSGKPNICREVVQDMKMSEAVEYLLNFIERSFASQQGDLVTAVLKVSSFTNSEAKIMLELSTGTFRPRAFLHDLICVGKSVDEEPDIKIIDVFISKIRKKILVAGWPVEIKVIWGKGYILNRFDPNFRFPWESVNG